MADDPLITADDPRVKQILAMIQARNPTTPVATDPSASQAQVVPQAAPIVPSQLPGVPPIAQQVQAAPPDTQMQSPTPSIAPVAAPNAPPVDPTTIQPKPGPIKSFLQHLVSGLGQTAYAGTQGVLQHYGIPTDYEKQQNALKIGLQQQQQDSLEGLRAAQQSLAEGKGAQLDQLMAPKVIDKDDMSVLPQLRGTTTTFGKYQALQDLSATLQGKQGVAETNATSKTDVADTKAQNALALEQLKQVGGNPRDHQIRSVNGQIGLYSKRDGSLIKTLGGDTALITPVVRARANAAYAGAQVMDSDQNPTTVSRLTQLQTGAPTMNDKAVQTLSGDKLGAVTYLAANSRVEKNLPVLADPVQRGIIARATQEVDRNPGAIDSIINSSLQEGLSPQGAELIAAMKQMNEFGSTFKKYTGNGGSSTDSLRATIQSNQPSTANSLAVNQQLLQQDRALATGVLTNLSRPGKYTVPSKAPSVPAPASGGVIYAVDPQGVTHQAPAGTPLPPGWKAK